ncbi:conserved protein of unknown function [Paraburkholderia dioscoreae]|uniref:Uncharacterized protein n=1 Tax=Paraburkholderia dioscoreae TaxID=2604047 RepID=A0A5Q4ZR03_9BURK|nr:conserved protein of unknown function [Paraburkholderia dioscoreae]
MPKRRSSPSRGRKKWRGQRFTSSRSRLADTPYRLPVSLFIDIRFSLAPPHPRKTRGPPRTRFTKTVAAAGKLLPPVYLFAASRLQRISLYDSLFATAVPCGVKALLRNDLRFGGGCFGEFATRDDSDLRRRKVPWRSLLNMQEGLFPEGGKPLGSLTGNSLADHRSNMPAPAPMK